MHFSTFYIDLFKIKRWEDSGGLFSKQKLFFKINKHKITCFQNAEMQYLQADFSELSS